MRSILSTATLVAAALAFPSLAPAQTSLLDNVVRAMGGKDRVLAVRTITLTGTGDNFNFGQGMTPEPPLPRFEVTQFRRILDFANRRWRLEQSREPRFTTPNTAVQRQVAGVDGDVGYDVPADGTPRRSTAQAAKDRSYDLTLHPLGFLRAAYAEGSEVSAGEPIAGLRHVRLTVGGEKFAMLIDPRTNLPARTRKVIYNAMIGDAVLEVRFSDWREVSGVRVPMRVVQRLDGRYPLSDIRMSAAELDAEGVNLAASDSVRAAAPAPAPVITVTVEEVASGLWLLAGQSHHSVVIEMSDHLLLVEAPQSDARTLAVIEKARALRPNKPLRSVINTHHHFDHAGGIRAAMSEGLTVITHQGNKVFYDSLARRRHSIIEDAQSKNTRRARVEGVAARRVLTDGSRRVEIHHIRGNPHAATLLMVYLPAEKMLIEADVYNPPAAGAPTPPARFSPNLLANIDRLGLNVDQVIPIHGRIFSIADLKAAAEASRRASR